MIVKRFKERHGKWNEKDIKTHLGNDDFLKEKIGRYLKFTINKYKNDSFINVNYFFFDSKTDDFYVQFDNDMNTNKLEKLNFEDVLEFINNEKIFINSKKYNL